MLPWACWVLLPWACCPPLPNPWAKSGRVRRRAPARTPAGSPAWPPCSADPPSPRRPRPGHQAGQRISDPMRASGGLPSPSRLASALALALSSPPQQQQPRGDGGTGGAWRINAAPLPRVPNPTPYEAPTPVVPGLWRALSGKSWEGMLGWLGAGAARATSQNLPSADCTAWCQVFLSYCVTGQ
jgi:hypothetical protein